MIADGTNLVLALFSHRVRDDRRNGMICYNIIYSISCRCAHRKSKGFIFGIIHKMKGLVGKSQAQ